MTQDFFYKVTPSIAYLSTANKRINNVTTSYGASWDSSNTIGVAVDIDSGTVTFYVDNSSQGAISFDATGLLPVFGDNTGGSGFTVDNGTGLVVRTKLNQIIAAMRLSQFVESVQRGKDWKEF